MVATSNERKSSPPGGEEDRVGPDQGPDCEQARYLGRPTAAGLCFVGVAPVALEVEHRPKHAQLVAPLTIVRSRLCDERPVRWPVSPDP